MRKLFVAYLLLLHVALAVAAWKLHQPALPDEQAARAAVIANGVTRAMQSPTAVAIVGDSRVADLAASSVAPYAETYGIGSEPLELVAGRLPLYRFNRARAILIESGIKEWHERRFEGFAARYRAMLSTMPPGVPVVAVALAPVDETRTRPRWQGVNAALPGANAAIEAACAAHPRCVYAPQPFGATLQPRYHIGDGLHFTPEGTGLMAASMRAALARQTL